MGNYFILEKNNDIAEKFHDYFTSVCSKFNIPRYQDSFTDSDQTEYCVGHWVLRIFEEYKNYPSIISSNNQNMDREFSFQESEKSEKNTKF